MKFKLLSMLPGLLICMNFSCSAQSMRFVEENGQVILTDQGRHIFSYQVETKSHDGEYPRANYVHPLNDFDGASLTEDFPEDHLHQRGIFWTWHQLYLDGKSVSDPWICSDIVWDVYDVKHEIKSESAQVSATVDWVIGDDRQKLVRENLMIMYQGFEDYYLLDFNIALQALQDNVGIGGSDDIKGYGGFSARLALGDEVSFSNGSGEIMPHNEQVEAGNWILVDDIGNNEGQIAIMYHPQSTADLKGWILRKKGSMQNPVWPGRQRFILNKGDDIKITARLVVFNHRRPKPKATDRDKANTLETEKFYLEYVNQ